MKDGPPITFPFGPGVLDAVKWCVFRRAERVDAALTGDGDIDLLIAPRAHDAVTGALRAAGAVRGRPHPCHDNAVPNREEWFYLDPARGKPVHLDLQFGIRVGPRYAKTFEALDLVDAEPFSSIETAQATMPVANPIFQVKLALAKAAFRTRSLFPFGSVRVSLDVPLPDDSFVVAGVRLRPRPDRGGARVNARDLARLRASISRRNGAGVTTSVRVWASHIRRLACYKISRGLDLVGFTPTPNRQPAGGGLVVSLLGPDGMGKSSQSERLLKTFSAVFATRSCYLGSSGLLSTIVLALRSARPSIASKPSEPRARPQSWTSKLVDAARAGWGVWLAHYRLRAVRRAKRLARRGYIVISDRWPQDRERGLLDGPIRREIPVSWGWVDRLYAHEARLYSRIGAYAPDISFHLIAPYDVAEARKPGELTLDGYEKRVNLLAACRKARRSQTFKVDAAEPFEDVHRALLTQIWAHLVAASTSVRENDPTSAQKRIWSPLYYSVGGQIVHTLGQLGVLASLSHLKGIEAVGAFGLAISLVTPIFILGNMGLRTTQAIDQRGEFTFPEYAGFRIITSLTALVLSVGVGLFFTAGTEVLPILLLYSVAKAFESISGLAYGTFLRAERVELVFRSFLIRSVATVVVFSSLLWIGAPVWTAFLAQVGVWSVVALGLDLPSAWKVNGTQPGEIVFDRRNIMAIARRTFPVGGTGVLIGLQPALLRIFVEGYLGLAALGIFTNIGAIFQAGAMISNAIRQFLSARFSKLLLIADPGSTCRTIIVLVSAILVASALGLGFAVFLGDAFLLVVFGQETSRHGDLLILVALALAFRLLSAVTISLGHAYNRAFSLFLQEIFYIGVLVVLSLLLMPTVGLLAPGWIILITSALRFATGGIAASQDILGSRKERVG